MVAAIALAKATTTLPAWIIISCFLKKRSKCSQFSIFSLQAQKLVIFGRSISHLLRRNFQIASAKLKQQML
jgi:hypothetical protein